MISSELFFNIDMARLTNEIREEPKFKGRNIARRKQKRRKKIPFTIVVTT